MMSRGGIMLLKSKPIVAAELKQNADWQTYGQSS
jgi:hypothetical protein